MKKANAHVIWYTIVLCLLAIGAMPFAYTQVNYMATPILMALASAHIIWIQRSQLKVRAQIIPVCVFLVLGFVSITVNQTMAYLPYWSTLASILFLLTISGLGDKETFLQIKKTTVAVLALFHVLSFVMLFLFYFTDLRNSPNPMISTSIINVMQGGRLYGISAGPNLLGMLSATLAVIAANDLRNGIIKRDTRTLILNIALIIMACASLVLTGSRSALLASFAGFAFIVFASIPSVKARRIIFTILLIALAVCLFFLPAILQLLSDLTGRDWVTGSHRTRIWGFVASKIMEHPLLGNGGNLGDMIREEGGFGVTTAHNLYIELSGIYGIPAMLCFVWMFLYGLWLCIKDFLTTSRIAGYRILLYSLLVALITRSLFESSIELSMETFLEQLPVFILLMRERTEAEKES